MQVLERARRYPQLCGIVRGAIVNKNRGWSFGELVEINDITDEGEFHDRLKEWAIWYMEHTHARRVCLKYDGVNIRDWWKNEKMERGITMRKFCKDNKICPIAFMLWRAHMLKSHRIKLAVLLFIDERGHDKLMKKLGALQR